MVKEFKDVPGYEGRYKVSNYGELISIRNGNEKVLNGSISNKGYIQYTLNYKEKGLYNVWGGHVIVAMAFLNHKPNGTNYYVVDHIDDNRKNNRLDNLRVISNRENSIKKGSSCDLFGVTRCKNRFYAQVWHNGKNVHLGSFDSEIAAHNSVIEYINKNNLTRITS